MASITKQLQQDDVTNLLTLLHEAVPITGSIISGTYGDDTLALGTNIKNYGHARFQSVYDYPYLSASSNHIFDVSVGIATSSAHIAATQSVEKSGIYNQMAQTLMGYDATGSIQAFDLDGDLSTGGDKVKEAFFINFSRLLYKDEIKKGSFAMTFMTGAYSSSYMSGGSNWTINDSGSATSFKVNSPAGEYGILKDAVAPNRARGLLFYQAGIAVLSGTAPAFAAMSASNDLALGGDTFVDFLTGSSITASCDALRHRIYNISFNNTIELNSSVYFCRVKHNEFNYSSNPTYMNASKIVVKDVKKNAPVSYITGIELMSADGAVLARAKLSEPLKNSSDQELAMRVRLDY